MLCPECRVHVASGAKCPQCGRPVPERETFGGQGEHYFKVLMLLALGVFVVFIILSGLGSGFSTVLQRLFTRRWNWLFLLLFVIPIGIYTWNTLRSEEISVTDTYISKQSRWGNQLFAWAQIKAFRRIPLIPKASWIRRLTSIRRLIPRERLAWHIPVQAYELVGYGSENEEPPIIRLEPGTIDDLPWLLELIQEHMGPPTDE
jgi:hypothetical protein